MADSNRAPHPELRGVLALVTGASSGIGAAYARRLAAAGTDLIVVARRRERLEALAGELEPAHQVRVSPLVADLSDPTSPRQVFEAAQSLGAVRVLVNNAGLGAYGPFLDQPLEAHLHTSDVNDRALMELCWHFGRHMRTLEQPCWISNVASLAAFQSAPGYAVYGASKSFVRIFSETLAHELRDTQVRVSCLCPGATYTEFMEKAKMEVTEAGHATFMSAEAVAEIGIEGMLRGRPTVVPGAVNKLAAFLPRFAPTGLSLKLADIAMRRSVRSLD